MGLQLFTLSGFPSLGRGTTFATFQAWGITLVVKDRLRRKVNSGTRALKASFSIWDDKLAIPDDLFVLIVFTILCVHSLVISLNSKVCSKEGP